MGDTFNLQFTQRRKSWLSLEVKEFTQPKEAGADFVKSDFRLKLEQVKIGGRKDLKVKGKN